MNSDVRKVKAASPRRGFTLVELLVVIVIIVILAALSFQGVTYARSMATRTRCMGQLRNWGAAMGGYAADHAGLLEWEPWPSIGTDPLQYSPFISYWTADSDDRSGFTTQLEQRNCPAIKYDKTKGNSPVTYATIQPIGISKIGITARASGSTSAYSLSKIKNPARFMLMIESIPPPDSKSGYSISVAADFTTRVKPLTVKGVDLRHNFAVNTLFADYSVRSMTWKDVSAGVNWWSTF